LSRIIAGAVRHPTNDTRMRDSFGRLLPPLDAEFRILPISGHG
jgi:hypothetical protein